MKERNAKVKEKNRICLPAVKRLPMYYRLLCQLKGQEKASVSSAHIAKELALEAIVVRKDMTNIGIVGKPRVGFDVLETIEAIEKIIKYSPNDAFLVGAGYLGQALLAYKGFVNMGLNIVAGFDCDPGKIGMHVAGKEIFDISELSRLIGRLNIEIGILCVPEAVSQEMADVLIESGIKGIWNFTPAKLKVPEDIVVRHEDIAQGLVVLTVKLNEQKGKFRK